MKNSLFCASTVSSLRLQILNLKVRQLGAYRNLIRGAFFFAKISFIFQKKTRERERDSDFGQTISAFH